MLAVDVEGFRSSSFMENKDREIELRGVGKGQGENPWFYFFDFPSYFSRPGLHLIFRIFIKKAAYPSSFSYGDTSHNML